VSGTNIFEHLGVQTPSLWEWTQQNKFYACLMTFFLCNAVEGQLISTGAFEITLNGEILFHIFCYLLYLLFFYLFQMFHFGLSWKLGEFLNPLNFFK
jgi:hypothetical protein